MYLYQQVIEKAKLLENKECPYAALQRKLDTFSEQFAHFYHIQRESGTAEWECAEADRKIAAERLRLRKEIDAEQLRCRNEFLIELASMRTEYRNRIERVYNKRPLSTHLPALMVAIEIGYHEAQRQIIGIIDSYYLTDECVYDPYLQLPDYAYGLPDGTQINFNLEELNGYTVWTEGSDMEIVARQALVEVIVQHRSALHNPALHNPNLTMWSDALDGLLLMTNEFAEWGEVIN